MKLLYCIVPILFGLSGCNIQNNCKTLHTADSLMLCQPDSALAILLQFTDLKKLSEDDYAYYALLMTQAMHKNYVTFESDSLIQKSVKYYTKTNDIECKAKALFYQGVVYEEMGNKKQALLSYKKAEEFISKINDKYLISLIYEYLGIINSEFGLLDRAKPYYHKSLEQALQLNQYNLIIANLEHIGMDYLRQNRIDSAMIYYEKALEYLPHLSDNEKAGVYHNLGAFYLINVKSQRQTGYSFLKKAIQLADAPNKLRTYVILANSYAENGQYELADSLWTKSMETNDEYIRACIYNARLQLCEQVGDYKSALAFSKKFYTLTDSLSVFNRNKSIAEIQAKYDLECVYRKYSNIWFIR